MEKPIIKSPQFVLRVEKKLMRFVSHTPGHTQTVTKLLSLKVHVVRVSPVQSNLNCHP